MKMSKSVAACVAALGVFALVSPAPASLQVSLGIRETGAGGGAEGPVGGDAGTAGGIEFVNLDGQTVPFDGQWRRYAWDLDADPLTAFAGTTANSILEGAYGALEHMRFRNHAGVVDPITVWVDLVVNTVNSGPVVVQDFEGFADGAEVMFQEPSLSGSTSSNLLPGSTAAVDSSTAFSGVASYRLDWTFVDSNPTRWLRLTTFSTPIGPSPLIRFDQDSEVSVYMKAVPEPATVMLLSVGLFLAVPRRRPA